MVHPRCGLRRRAFGALPRSRAQARAGSFNAWAQTPEGALGLILLLDQFSRNIHRGTPLAFAADARALALARRAIARGCHQALPAPLASWLLLPFEHAEDLDAQQRAVALFESLGLTIWWYAKLHLDIIAASAASPTATPSSGENRRRRAGVPGRRRLRRLTMTSSPGPDPAILAGFIHRHGPASERLIWPLS